MQIESVATSVAERDDGRVTSVQTGLPVVDLRDEPAALRARLRSVGHDVGFFHLAGHGVLMLCQILILRFGLKLLKDSLEQPSSAVNKSLRPSYSLPRQIIPSNNNREKPGFVCRESLTIRIRNDDLFITHSGDFLVQPQSPVRAIDSGRIS
jgi:hypothetical protein